MHRYILPLGALLYVWLVLTENLSVFNIAAGLFVGVLALLFSARFLPFSKITNVRFSKLALFPLYLIWQIYVAGFYVIRILLSGHKVDIVTVSTKLENETLRIILVDSITLTPGSILLELEDKEISLLWLHSKDTPLDPKVAGDLLMEKLEKKLLKAQK